MALLIDGGRIPPRWAEKKGLASIMSGVPYEPSSQGVRIALVNNMPDAALEDTEMQFLELLDTASGDMPVRLSLHSLPGVPRGERGKQHLEKHYFDLQDLWHRRIDALIVTGTEPRQPDLRQEPYWQELTEVLDWAEDHTASTVLSCLAAHAGVLHSDGVQRQPLSDKRFGVFESAGLVSHELTRHAARPMRFPHSRWNEVREESLMACGYSILTSSPQAGADLFVKRKKNSLFVHFQGHPEYGSQTLLKEYRRDIKRFLRQERPTYPTMPYGYFDRATERLLVNFQESALAHPREEQMLYFPESLVADSLQNAWGASAVTIYCNWLYYVRSRAGEKSAFAAIAQGRRPSVVASSELV